METIKELFFFLKVRKKYFLFPLVFVCVVLGGLLVLGSGSAITPFIYALF